MVYKTTIVAFCLLTGIIPAAKGFSSDGSSLTRNFDRTTALTNSPIVVTATFTNGGSAAIRGFYFAEQLPSELEVSSLSVLINGVAITNCTFESGQSGDVHAGCTPYRWILERPAGFIETNPVPAQTPVQIVYSVKSSIPGTFVLQQFSWTGYDPGNTNAVFGHSESTNQQSLTFAATNNPPILLTGQFLTNAFVLSLAGQPGNRYVIDVSPDLIQWTPLITNIAPFDFADTNTSDSSNHFYGARPLD